MHPMKPDVHAATASAGILGRVAWWAGRAEDAILATALFLMAVIPVVEIETSVKTDSD